MQEGMLRAIAGNGELVSFDEVTDRSDRRLVTGDRLAVWAVDDHPNINFYHRGIGGAAGLAGHIPKEGRSELVAALKAKEPLQATVLSIDGRRCTASVALVKLTKRQ